MDSELILSRFFELVRIDSPSGAEQNIQKKLIPEFTGLGCTYVTDNAGNLKFELAGTAAGSVRLFSAHLDTVQPGCGIVPQIDADGVITSDGTTILGADDKDGITAIWCALDETVKKRLPHPPLEILFSVEEENGLVGARSIEASWLKSDIGWVFDGPGDIGVYYRNGVGKICYRIEVHGLEAHSGICPEKGRNAMLAAAAAMVEMPPGHTGNGGTLNYGTIKGGTSDNIVPGNVELTGELRAPDQDQLQYLDVALKQSWSRVMERYGCQVKMVQTGGYPAFSLSADSPHRTKTEKALRSCGFTPKLEPFRAGCDANYLSALNIDICTIATGRRNNHTKKESTTLENLRQLTKIAAQLMLPD